MKTCSFTRVWATSEVRHGKLVLRPCLYVAAVADRHGTQMMQWTLAQQQQQQQCPCRRLLHTDMLPRLLLPLLLLLLVMVMVMVMVVVQAVPLALPLAATGTSTCQQTLRSRRSS